MFNPREDILYEDNHILVVNKRRGDLVQPDRDGDPALENEIKEFIKVRDNKPGAVFLGVVHRIDRPVSGAVLFAKTSKALTRMNEAVKDRRISKTYNAIVVSAPEPTEGELRHWIVRDQKSNRSRAYDSPREGAKEAVLIYKMTGATKNYFLLEIELITGRHHQIRAQLSKFGCAIRGDLKYGAPRSVPGGGIDLHARRLSFRHPVKDEQIDITAPYPKDNNIWKDIG